MHKNFYKGIWGLLFSLLILGINTSSAETASFPVLSNISPRFWLDVGLCRGGEKQTQVEVYYSMTNEQLLFKTVDEGRLATFAFTLSVKNSANQVVFEKTRRKGVRASALAETSDKTRGAIDQFVFNLPAGDYKLEAKMKDEYTEDNSSITADFHISAFSEQLSMSDPQLATLISSDLSQETFVKANRAVIPNASRRYRYNHSILYLYFEVYNLIAPADSGNSQFQVGYTITDILGDSLIYIPMQSFDKPGTSCVKTQALDIRGLERGEHILSVTVFDPASNQTITQKKSFWIYAPEQVTQILPMAEENIKKYRDQIKYFATHEELDLFDQLDPKGKETFLLNFWHSKDTNPETPENEFMQDCFSRIHYANKHFKGRDSGLNSDMGRIFVIYGQPDDIENHTMEFSTKPYVIWYYFTSGGGQHSFVFVDRGNEGIYSLVHSTVEEEIKNRNWMEQELR